MLRRLLILPLLFAGVACSNAQNSFTQVFGGPQAHDGVGVVQNGTGWSVAVRAFLGAELGHRALVFDRSGDGAPIDQIQLELTGITFLQAMVPAGSGGSFICGSVLPPGGRHQALVARIDHTGQVLWLHTLEGPASQQFLDLTPLADGGVALCGMVAGGNGHEVLVARYNANGSLLWSQIQAFDLDAEGYAIAANGSSLMVTGRQVNFGGTSDALFLLYTMEGSLILNTSWGGVENEEGRALKSTSDGNFVMAGSTRSYGPADPQGRRRSNIHLIKIDPNGDTLWTRTYGDILIDRQAMALDIAPNGDLLVAGNAMGTGTASNDGDALVARFGPDGALLWERRYDLERDDRLLDLRALPDGFVAAGWTFGNHGRKVLLLRRNGSGD